jgi:hypothetical protein
VDNQSFKPETLQLSKMRFYSLGIVAANKSLTSKEIEVTPTEELPMLDGELSSTNADYKSKAKDGEGKAYNTSISSKVTIKASWLRLGDSNRMTAPDVRRGEAVMIYQFANADKYYWMTLKEDSKLRKLETVVYAFSGTKNEGKDTSAEDSYYLEVSTHRGVVHFHTSKANGEPFEYDIQINAKDGNISITDDAGNYFQLDSTGSSLRLQNSSGSSFEVNKENVTVELPGLYHVKAATMVVDCPDVTHNSAKFDVNGSTTLNGPLKQGKGSGGGGAIMQGPVIVAIDVVASGISLTGHRHPDAQSGNVGTPI